VLLRLQELAKGQCASNSALLWHLQAFTFPAHCFCLCHFQLLSLLLTLHGVSPNDLDCLGSLKLLFGFLRLRIALALFAALCTLWVSCLGICGQYFLGVLVPFLNFSVAVDQCHRHRRCVHISVLVYINHRALVSVDKELGGVFESKLDELI